MQSGGRQFGGKLSVLILVTLLPVTLCGAPLAAQDWNDTLRKAIEHRRYGMRIAASKQIAKAGDEAVAAIRTRIEQSGPNAIPLALVDAIARAEPRGPATLRLLEEWADNRAFYWRAQALGGLARRRVAAAGARFQRALRDVGHLYRIEGARGAYLLGNDADREEVYALLDHDPDPRVRVRLAAFLAEQEDWRGLPILIAVLRHDDAFLGDPWVSRERTIALGAAVAVAGEDHGYDRTRTPVENREAIDRLEAAMRTRAENWREVRFDRASQAFAGGVGIRSCRNGDLFLRWTGAGQVVVGLEPGATVTLGADAWSPLRTRIAELERTKGVAGEVVCDFLQIQASEPSGIWKCAPGALSAPLRAWLVDLAAALEHSNGAAVAEELNRRLQQFASAKDD